MAKPVAEALDAFLTVSEAAGFLGVSPWTLRNWDKSGKLKPFRHPMNGYRLYRQRELESLLMVGRRGAVPAAAFDWDAIGETEHFVQFYETDTYLVKSISAYVGKALLAGEGAVIIATPSHRKGVDKQLRALGVDVRAALESGQYVALDAAKTLAQFMVDGSPVEERFTEVIGGTIARIASGRTRVRAFGEMVALLWAEGNRTGACGLEALWNELAKRQPFALFCAYPLDGFGVEADGAGFSQVCGCHVRVIPAEGYVSLATNDSQLRAISVLQQKAQALEAEVARRRRAEHELADCFDNAAIGVHWVGPDGVILRANRAELRMLGYDEGEYVGRHIAEFHADASAVEDILRRLHAGEELQDYDARLRCSDGSIKDVCITSNALFEGGRFIHTRCFTRDVSENKRTRNALLAREAEAGAQLADSRLIAAISAELIHGNNVAALYDKILATAVTIMQADAASMHMLFADRAQPGPGAELRRIAHTGFCAAGAMERERLGPGSACSCGRALRAGARVVISDVERCDFIDRSAHRRAGTRACQSTPLVSRGGAVVGMLSTYWKEQHEPTERDWRLLDTLARQAADLIERIRGQEALQDRTLQFETLVNQAPLGICLVDADFRIVQVNPISAAAFGEFPGGVIGRDFAGVIHALWEQAGADEIVGHFRRTLATGESYVTAEWMDVRRDTGATECYEWRIDRIQLPGGGLGVVCYFRDVSAQVQAREALKEMDRRKDEFLATLAHELRNPLAPLRNSLQILKMSSSDPGAGRVHDMMERQVSHMVRLVDDLMEISRISQGRIDLNRQRVDLASVVRHAVELSRHLIDGAGHTLTLALPLEPVLVVCDSARVTQVFSNLLNNAAKYTGPRGKIDLRVECVEGQIVASVRDTGIGIPQSMLGRVFELFTRIENPLRPSQDGLGIGLNLARQIIQLHGGTIEARSEGLGLGSEFVVRLPAGQSDAGTHGQAAAIEAVPLRERILVVDDNKDAADSLATVLRLLGADVQVAYDGVSALESLRSAETSIAIVDIGMPGMDGYELARQVRRDASCHGLTLIALTGWGQAADRRRAQEAGFAHHLVKPAEFGAIQALLLSIAASRGEQAGTGA